MKRYLFSLLVIGASVRCADQQGPVDALRKECALVAIDAFLFDVEKKSSAADKKAYELSLPQRDFIINEEWGKVTHPAIKSILYGDDYKERVKSLYARFATPQTPRRKLSYHVPVDSDPRAAEQSQKEAALKKRIAAVYQKLGLDK